MDGRVTDNGYGSAVALQPIGYRDFGRRNVAAGLYAYVDNTNLYVTVAGEVSTDNQIVIFLETAADDGVSSLPPNLPPCLDAAYTGMRFDRDFSPNFVLVMRPNNVTTLGALHRAGCTVEASPR